MKLIIIGDNSNISRKETKVLIDFLLKELFGKKKEKLKLIHEFIIDYRNDKNVEAGMSGYMEHNETNLGFDINIWVRNSMSRVETLKTICHEVVHVKQEVVDERKDGEGTENGYDNDPFENEAFAAENPLYDKYVSTHTIESAHYGWFRTMLGRFWGLYS